MQVNTQAEPINFKWNRKTHLEMTMLALKDCNLDKSTIRQIARYSQMPDFCKEELGFHCNTHFYFPNSKSKSFGPNSDKNNALEFFIDHVNHAVFGKKENDFLKYSGYAIHYLQDVAVPLHTEANNFIRKFLKYHLHKQFERGDKYGVNKHIDEFIADYKAKDIEIVSIVDLFKNTAEFSQQPKLKVKNSNKDEWKSIQQTCFNRSVDATTLLFKKLTMLKEFFSQGSLLN